MPMKTISHLVVHYALTYPDQDIGVAEIDRWHRERGFRMCGYHYVIRRDGTVEKGRPDTMVGAHVGGMNSGKLGICWVGGLEPASGPNVGVDNRTPEQEVALTKLIGDLKARHPDAQVVGHRDLAPTQCPAFDVIAWWARVSSTREPAHLQPPDDAPARTPGVIEGDIYKVKRGDTLWAIARAHDVSVNDLALANGMKPADILRPGDVLRIPAAGGQAAAPAPGKAADGPEAPATAKAAPEPPQAANINEPNIVGGPMSQEMFDSLPWQQVTVDEDATAPEPSLPRPEPIIHPDFGPDLESLVKRHKAATVGVVLLVVAALIGVMLLQ